MLADQRRFDEYVAVRFRLDFMVRLRKAKEPPEKMPPEKMPKHVRRRLLAQLRRLG